MAMVDDEGAKVVQLRPPKLQLIASTEKRLPLTGKNLTTKSRNELMEVLNGQYAIVRHGGKVLVMTFEKTEHKVGHATYSRVTPTFLTFNDFRNLYMHQTVRQDEEDIPVGKWWLHQEDRRQFDGLIYAPGDNRPVIDNKFNLWRGWGVEPAPGDWSRMREHIDKALAGGDEEKSRYILNWLAWAVQHPDQRAETSIVFRGQKGTGKGTLGNAMMRIFGAHGRHISSSQSLIGNFNSHLRDCSFLFADEALWPGDRSGEGSLKRLITEPSLSVEAKHHDAVEVPNMLHVMMASNENWIVPVSSGERRFVLFEVSPIFMQDETHFTPLYEEMANGGLGAMLFDLLNHNLEDFHPRQLPPDTGLLDQQRESLQPLDAWICELLESGRLMGSHWKYPNRAVSTAYDKEVETSDGHPRIKKQLGLYDQARQMVPRLRTYATDTSMGHHLSSIGVEPYRLSGKRGWRFPPLSQMRKAWEERFGGWNWIDPTLTEWQAEADGEDDSEDDGPLDESERRHAQEVQAKVDERRAAKEKEKNKGVPARNPPEPLTPPRKSQNAKRKSQQKQ